MDDSVYVHPTALVETKQIGANTRIWAFAHIMCDVTVGENCNIGDHCYIESGVNIGNNVTVKNGIAIWEKVTIEDHVFLGPNVVFTNDLVPRSEIKKGSSQLVPTLVRCGASIGANATILCGITIGRYAFIGAGSVLTKDVPDHALVYGNPATIHAYLCKCGEKIDFNKPCKCGSSYTKDKKGTVFLKSK